MAKRKVHGTELFKVAKEGAVTNPDRLTIWEKEERSLFSDGKVLRRITVRFKPDSYEPKGRLHDYGWKLWATLKPEGDPAKLLAQYQAKGFVVVGHPNLGALRPDHQEKAAKALKAAEKRKADEPKRAAADLKKNGPGFYVRNRFIGQTSFVTGKNWATNHGPVARAEDALSNAEHTLKNYRDMKFGYLLPVQIVQAESRDQAETGGGIVWWSDGKTVVSAKLADDAPGATTTETKEAATDKRQLKLF